jgi:hypothetical protein
VFAGDVFNNSAEVNGQKAFYITGSEINEFLTVETMVLFTSVLIITLLLELEVNFVSTLKKIIKIDEIKEK